MSTLTGLGAGAIRDGVQKGEFQATEVVRAHLDRIASQDSRIGAYLHLLSDRALQAAQRVDASASRSSLPLAGVPVAIKDVLNIDGVPTTCGSKILEDYRPPYTSTAVARLEAAGAIILGKTNMDEFAMGSSTENSAYHKTRNPWDPSRVPGGSSGGSAAAVSARLATLGLGSDTGGSIRQPAALCGVVGLKPTYGRVSRFGLVAFASSLDQVGPVSRSVSDAALVSEVLFGPDARDSTSAPEKVPAFSRVGTNIEGLRIGVPWAFLGKGVEPGVHESFSEALKVLEGLGARTVEVALPHAPHAIATYYLVATAEASSNLARYDGVRYGFRAGGEGDLGDLYGETRDRGFGPEVKRRIILGTFVLSSGYYDAYYLRAQKVRTMIRRDFEAALLSCDVVATPTSPSTAFAFGEKTDDPLQMYLADVFTVPANLSGNPALSVPSGLSNSLPVGLQFIARSFDEETLFRVGGAYEKASPPFPAPPET